MLPLDFPQQKAHGVAIVTASEGELLGDDLAGSIQGHGRLSGRIRKVDRASISDVGTGDVWRGNAVHG
jgi:hypothetical protein